MNLYFREHKENGIAFTDTDTYAMAVFSSRTKYYRIKSDVETSDILLFPNKKEAKKAGYADRFIVKVGTNLEHSFGISLLPYPSLQDEIWLHTKIKKQITPKNNAEIKYICQKLGQKFPV